MAERNARAQARLLSAAETIGAALGLEAPVAAVRAVRSRDPQLMLVFQREALADLLEQVAAALITPVSVSAETPGPIVAGDGLDQPPTFDEPPVIDPPIVAEELVKTKAGKSEKKAGK